jgi:hypothetical protein
MDVVVPSICLSSVAGAILFYAGGRLHARPAPPVPPTPEVELERAARRRAEEETAGTLRATRDAVAALAEERSRSTALREALASEQDARTRTDADAEAARLEAGRARVEAAQARAETERATAAARRLSTEAGALRAKIAEIEAARGREGEAQAKAIAAEARASQSEARATKAEAKVAEALAKAAEALAKAASAEGIREENQRLERAISALEQQRAATPDLAEVQRRALSATMALRTLEQRSEEVARREAENVDLRQRVEALSGAAVEAEALRRRVRELEARGFAEATHGFPRADEADEAPISESLESSLSIGLREVCQEEGCRAAVLSDMRGLLIAAFGEDAHRLELAAAAALTTTTAERLRELLPLGEPLAFTLADANAIVFRTRWLRWEDECFLLSTLGATPAKGDAPAEAIRGRLAALLGHGSAPSPRET